MLYLHSCMQRNVFPRSDASNLIAHAANDKRAMTLCTNAHANTDEKV